MCNSIALLSPIISDFLLSHRRAGSEESFVVHRGKGIPTLSSVADEKSVARAEAAGRPSNWEDQRRSSYAGRRSRRNSVSDDSQLTIENFGGSQVHKLKRSFVLCLSENSLYLVCRGILDSSLSARAISNLFKCRTKVIDSFS